MYEILLDLEYKIGSLENRKKLFATMFVYDLQYNKIKDFVLPNEINIFVPRLHFRTHKTFRVENCGMKMGVGGIEKSRFKAMDVGFLFLFFLIEWD